MTREQMINHLRMMRSGVKRAIKYIENLKELSEEDKEDIEIYKDQLEAFNMAMELLEQQPNDCKIFGTKENCFGGATENECENCDYKIQSLEQQHSDDCVRVLNRVMEYTYGMLTTEKVGLQHLIKSMIEELPSVTPTHGTCKDCKHYYMDEDGHGCHCEKFDYTRFPVYADFYCASFEKRGNENEIRN